MPPPEIPDQNHQISEISPELLESMTDRFLDDLRSTTASKPSCFPNLPETLYSGLEWEQERIYRLAEEHLIFFDYSGNVLCEFTGDRRSVRFLATPQTFRMPNLHNHIRSRPPSAPDVFAMASNEFPVSRIVARDGMVYDIGPGSSTLADLKLAYQFLDRSSWAVAEHCMRTRGLAMPDHERYCRRQHALLFELAKRDHLCYARYEWRNES